AHRAGARRDRRDRVARSARARSREVTRRTRWVLALVIAAAVAPLLGIVLLRRAELADLVRDRLVPDVPLITTIDDLYAARAIDIGDGVSVRLGIITERRCVVGDTVHL